MTKQKSLLSFSFLLLWMYKFKSMKKHDELRELNEKLLNRLEEKDEEINRLKEKIQHHEKLIDRLASYIPERGM